MHGHRTVVEIVKGSQRFTPDNDGGGTLRWTERVIRPGFRTTTRERAIHKAAHRAMDADQRDEADLASTAKALALAESLTED